MKQLLGKILILLAIFSLAGHIARADEKSTPLGDKMKIIAKSVKQLKKQIADPTKQQSSIDLVEAAQKAAEDGKQLVPAKAATVPEADRPKFIADYQMQIDALIKDFATIDTALHDGKYDDAQKAFDTLGDVKRDGHKKFNAEDK